MTDITPLADSIELTQAARLLVLFAFGALVDALEQVAPTDLWELWVLRRWPWLMLL